MTRSITDEEHLMLADRIRRAEARTSGEIYCVVARRSDTYFYPSAFILAVGMMLVATAVAVWLDRSWLNVSHLHFALVQLAAFAGALCVVWLAPGLRIRLVPRRLRHQRAHDNAIKQFLAHNVHVTAQRTGVLVFVSLAERHAEIVADSGINEKVTQSDWDGIIADLVKAASDDRLANGLEAAIGAAAVLLQRHFPGGTGNPNELEDHVVEI